MHIEELIGDKGEVIDRAMATSAMSPKRKPTIEQAMKAVMGEVEKTATATMANMVLPLLQDEYDLYTLTNGEYEDATVGGDIAPDEFSEGLDNAVERVLEPFNQYLSADWLARNTIDTQLWEQDAVSKLAASLGREVFKQVSYGKTPAQVLSNAGIMTADVEIILEQHLSSNPKKEKAMADDANVSAESIAAKIKAHIGTDYDRMEVYGDLELLVDDDEILAGGAGKRLGLDDSDIEAVQMVVLEMGEGTVDHLNELIENASDKAEKPKRTAKTKADKAAAPKPATTADGVDPNVLALMKAHGSTQDTKISAALGVSRATYNNWLNAKNVFAPDADQLSTLRDELVGNINGLLEALALLDGTEAMAVS